MNKVWIILLIIIFSNCERKISTTYEVVKVLSNNTSNTLYYSIKSNVGEQSGYLRGMENLSFSFRAEGKVALPIIGPYSFKNPGGVSFLKETLYNLNDTSIFIYYYDGLFDEQDSIYFTHQKLSVSGTEVNFIDTFKLTFDESLISIMPKDYTMLEKFKDYYSTSH